ncbi:unnamed protein product (macronuclear) [Paramecium tetraurelia]|uniref:Response regulatory domain-containing protein n=1 Tax=Paramecium tetraurelia TaxID=5888 RepID=A0BJY7_PARTE|nr:uncharacterized protein GSPATT00029484001 [Paramecium tetraurelia]CAK58854.1 unnamed protein product [Paramecium tetraurelia]|eukprot:XP_001426252.1 hypothetical protein (macronuclear) [Paramecium tetraurelia strain d4-2]
MAVGVLLGLSILLDLLGSSRLENNNLKVIAIYMSFCCKYLGIWFLGYSGGVSFLVQGIMCQALKCKSIFDHMFLYELIGMFGLILNIFNQERIVMENRAILGIEAGIALLFLIQFCKIMTKKCSGHRKHNLIQNQVIMDMIANHKLKQDYESTPCQSPRSNLQKLFQYNNFIIFKEDLEIVESNFDLKIHWINESSPNNNILIEQFLYLQVISSNFGESEQIYSIKEFILKFKDNLKTQFASFIISKSQVFDLENVTLNLMPFQRDEGYNFIVTFSYLSQSLIKRLKDDSNNQVLMDISRSLSHELGTNLNSIMVFSSLAMHDDEVPELVKQKYIQSLKINSEQLGLIVSNIRDYNLISLQQFNLKLEEFNINDEVKQIENLLIDTIKNKQINVVHDYQLSNSNIINDRQRFRQVYFQFLHNAVKFTTRNGTIRIKIESSRSQCQIAIQDSGPGLSEEEMARMQNILIGKNQFVQISPHSVGSGLGIGISNSIVKRLNGQNIPILCDQKGKGTTFTFLIKNHLHEMSNYDNKKSIELRSSKSIIRLISGNSYIESPFSSSVKFILPSISKSSDQINFKSSIVEDDNVLKQPKLLLVQDQGSIPISEDEFVIVQEPRNMNPKFQYEIIECSIQSNCCSRVLIVDDEYFNILSLQLLMQKHRAKCDYAYNGKEALNKIHLPEIGSSLSHLLIFIDINMPVLNGYQTVKEIKSLIQNKTIRRAWCVANTGFTDLDTKIQSFNSGMDYFLTKPLDAKNLHDLIVQMFPLHK